eukprot:m.63510 g.63510  ORF g.63510 m.63510 type:complete len:582 (-) comp8073_c1_seq2:979-2724(-)
MIVSPACVVLVVVVVLVGFFAEDGEAVCAITTDIAAARSNAENACGTSDLTSLITPTDFNVGSTSMCLNSCSAAMSKLLRSYPSDGSCDDDTTYLAYRRVQNDQRECNPPNQACSSIYLEYLFYLQSPEGQTCLAGVNNARALLTQDAYTSICTDDCYATITSFADQLLSESCGTWPAYLALRKDLDLLCVSNNDVYCEAEYFNNTDAINVAKNSSALSSARTTALSTVCTTCFNLIQNIYGISKQALGIENNEGNLCIKHDSSFCILALDEIEATVATIVDEDEKVNTRSREVCADATVKRCVQRMWSYEYAQPFTTTSRKSRLNSYLLYSCLRHQTSDNLCASLTQSLIEGLYLDAPNGFTCTPTDVSNGCSNPPSCLSWDNPSQCSFGCSSGVNEVVQTLGCCFNSVNNFHSAISSTPAVTSELFERMQFLSTSCCARQHSDCSELFAPQCSFQKQTQQLSVTIFDPPYQWIVNNEEAFTDAFISDLAFNTGHARSLFSSVNYREVTLGVTVTFSIAAASNTEINDIEAVLTDITSRRTFRQWNSLALYAQDSSAAHHIACVSFMFISILISSLFAFL